MKQMVTHIKLPHQIPNLGLGVGKKINDNISLSFNSNMDIKNDYSPYSQSLNLNLTDECSELVITYRDVRYNDNYNTTPNETLSISFIWII